MPITNNPTPGELISAIRELEAKISQPSAAFTSAELATGRPLLIKANTAILKQRTLENGDLYLLTFYLVGGAEKDCNMSFIYVVNDTPSYLDEGFSEPALYTFKDYSGAEHRLEVYIDLVTGRLNAGTTSRDLWIVRAGVMPGFGKLGDIYS